MRASVARAARAATKCATSTRPPGTCVCRFRFFAEAEGLAQTKIQGEASRAFRKVDRNNRLAGLRGQIKQPYGVALTPVAPGVHVPNAARVLKMESW